MDFDVQFYGNYNVVEKWWIFNFTKKGSFDLEHDFPAPSESFTEVLPIPGPLHIVVSLMGNKIKIVANLGGLLNVYSHTFDIASEITAMAKGNSKTWSFPGFSVLGVTLSDLNFKVTLK